MTCAKETELVGNDTMSKYVACLRVPDWKLVLFQAMARVSSKTWQSVINITGLRRTGVRCLVTLVLRRYINIHTWRPG